MKCEVCGQEFIRLESSLVCPNGHTIQNTLEVMDDDLPLSFGRRRKIRRGRRERPPEDRLPAPVSAMLVLTVLFREAERVFGLASDAALRYFTGYFRLTEAGGAPPQRSIDGDELPSVHSLLALVYIAKRSETERAGRAYPLAAFRETLARFDLNYRALEAARRYRVGWRVLQAMGFPLVKWRVADIERRVKDLVDFDAFASRETRQAFLHTTGVVPLRAERVKRNFLALLPHSLALYEEYFRALCRELRVELDERLLFYWRKFVYTENLGRVFVPEKHFALFVAQYFVDAGTFDDSELEGRVLNYLRTTRIRLRLLLKSMSARLDRCVDPGRFLRLLDSESRERYRNLSVAVWIVRAFREHLQNTL